MRTFGLLEKGLTKKRSTSKLTHESASLSLPLATNKGRVFDLTKPRFTPGFCRFYLCWLTETKSRMT